MQNPSTVGIFGFSFLDQNSEQLKGSLVDGVAPTFENIASGEYAVARTLYFYVKKQHIEFVPGLVEFIDEFTSEDAMGEFGYLSDKGLIPLADAERLLVRDGALGLQIWDGS